MAKYCTRDLRNITTRRGRAIKGLPSYSRKYLTAPDGLSFTKRLLRRLERRQAADAITEQLD